MKRDARVAWAMNQLRSEHDRRSTENVALRMMFELFCQTSAARAGINTTAPFIRALVRNVSRLKIRDKGAGKVLATREGMSADGHFVPFGEQRRMYTVSAIDPGVTGVHALFLSAAVAITVPCEL